MKNYIELYKKEINKFSKDDIENMNLTTTNRLHFNNRDLIRAGLLFFNQADYREKGTKDEMRGFDYVIAEYSNGITLHMYYLSIGSLLLFSLF